MTFDLRVPFIQPQGSSNTTVALEHVCLTLQLIFHIITLLPRSYLFFFLQSLKASSFSCLAAVSFSYALRCYAQGSTPERDLCEGMRKHLLSFGDSMTQQHDLAEVVHMPKFTNLNYKLGRWRARTIARAIIEIVVAYHHLAKLMHFTKTATEKT